MSGKTLKDVASEKFSDTITVQGITVEGVTPDTFNDFEFLEALAISMDPSAEDSEIVRAMAATGPIVFGAKQWKHIKAELRKQNDGRLTADIFTDFLMGTMAAVSAKNS